MAKLRDKIKLALDEARLLVLGSQILLGFQFRAALEAGFELLPPHARFLKLIGLTSILLASMLLMWPASFHQITEIGEDSTELHRFTTRAVCWALLPFALALALDFYVAMARLGGVLIAAAAGGAIGLLSLYFWFILEHQQRKKDGYGPEHNMNSGAEPKPGTKLLDKIDQLLTESRVIIPGAQALLGFQLAAMLMEGFEKLPRSSQYIHAASLGLIGMAVILLMTPAAYHRIVEQGEETERFFRFASRVILWSMVPLAGGVAGDFFVVIRKVTGSTTVAAAVSGASLATCYGAWFGYTWYRRLQRDRALPNALPQAG